ncbi:GNAT family N-acetyltransferase [Streptococcus sp. X16XC17]|uniref:GNAT family N-acetyltransferase n=1 Tax=unclassified Streptococcus TaxID=2608887 RepID=UPI00066FE412|nr:MULTISPECIES: GNAT family N-acetyltransferase [unclassified Streptococcus]TCD45445.1 GNAT family N-acetyltransferase [Streptococcus sp. X16XC17]
MEFYLKRFEELSLDELYGILAVRSEVFVVEQECAHQDIDGSDQVSLHLFAIDSEQVVAYLRILPPGVTFTEASIGRVLVKESYRSNGLARPMMQRAIDFIFEDMQENRIQISAQTYLKYFYASLGFEAVSEAYLEDGILHMDMILKK